jgi:hypothetical protein
MRVCARVAAAGFLQAGRSSVPSQPQYEEILRHLHEAADLCRRLEQFEAPLADEPVIHITMGGQRTSDPCCLVRRGGGGLRAGAPHPDDPEHPEL